MIKYTPKNSLALVPCIPMLRSRKVTNPLIALPRSLLSTTIASSQSCKSDNFQSLHKLGVQILFEEIDKNTMKLHLTIAFALVFCVARNCIHETKIKTKL